MTEQVETVDAPVEAPAETAPTEAVAPEVEAAPITETAETTAPDPVESTADWRARMSGGDEKKLSRLDRYASEQAVADALFAAQQKISSGDMQAKLPENPSDEELAAYRQEHGIPESFSEYEYNLPEGFSFGDHEKPFLDHVLQEMHAKNASPDLINTMLNAYANNVQQQADQIFEQDERDRTATEDALMAEWGPEYRKQHNIVKNYIDSAPDEVREFLLEARGPEGKAILNNPDVVRWLNSQALEINPAASVVSMTGRDTLSGVKSEIEQLKTEMNSDINAWHKSPEKKARYLELLEAEQKIEGRQ